MIILLFVILVTVLLGMIVNAPTALLYIGVFILGVGIVRLLNFHGGKSPVNIFGILYLVGGAYLSLCYLYMISHDYEWLLAYDSYAVFIPRIEDYVNSGNGNVILIIKDIISDYNFFSRDAYAFYVYTCVWAVLVKAMGADLYACIQISTLLLYSLSGIVLYLIFKQYDFSEKKSYSHTLVIFLLSIVFFYSSQILRDIHFMLCLLLAVYLSGKSRFSIVTLISLVVVIFVACNIRIETGLFLFLVIPLYFLISFQDKKNVPITIIAFFVLGIMAILFLLSNYNVISLVYSNNREAYVEGVEEGSGIIGSFQRVPIIGDILSILFTASMPIPCWSRLNPANNIEYGGNASNIMNIVRISASFLNVYTYVYIFYWIFSKKIRSSVHPFIKNPHRYHLWVGLLYLYLQSAVVAQRRVMGYYCIFYIFMFLIHDNISNRTRLEINRLSIGVFILLQIIGVLYFV